MRQYELTYLVSDKVTDTEMNAATGKINGMIVARGGKVLSEEGWGRRKLAYPIQKQEFASYATLIVELDPSELLQINRELTLSKNILRHLIVVKDEGKQTVTLTKEEIVATDAIEEVVGGERSFEAVEGETEESYDLMATRVETEVEDAEETKEQVAAETTEEATEAPAEEEIKEEKPKKAAAKKAPAKGEKEAAEEETAEAEETPAEEKPKKKTAKKSTAKADATEKTDEEADRLAKLNEEIEGILGDDL